MEYEFPKITHMNQVLAAIDGREEFVVKTDVENGLTIINYLVAFEDTFPPVVDERTALLRECRGITFDTTLGKVLNRKYHKFHNLGEKPETRPENIDFSQPHWILSKLDGSMITPLLVNNQVRFCTKMGMTEVAAPVDEWAKSHANYLMFCREMLDANYTPIFEWCSRQQRIVIDYPVDRLVLTAIRENVSGAYMGYEEMKAVAMTHNIEVVEQLPGSVTNIEHFMAQVHDLKGEEGYVVRFADGHMIKVKGAEYLQLHKALDNLRFEKDVIAYIVQNKLDDIKALLPKDLVARADAFAKQLYTNLHETADRLWWIAQAAYDNLNGGKKRFALEVVQAEPKNVQGLLFTAWDMIENERPMDDFYEHLLKLVLMGTSSGPKVDTVRHLFGNIHWQEAAAE